MNSLKEPPTTGAVQLENQKSSPVRSARPLTKKRPRVKPVGQPLTTRESEVLWLVAEGLSNKEIADRLSLSEHTAKFHVHNAGEKIGTTSRTKAAIDFALGQGDTALARIAPSSAQSEFAERRAKLLASARQGGAENATGRGNWISGFAVALAQVHRHGGGSIVVCEAARDAGLTIAAARGAGVSVFDLEELERAKIP